MAHTVKDDRNTVEGSEIGAEIRGSFKKGNTVEWTMGRQRK